MKKNIGDLDAYMRLSCGLTMFGIGIIKRSRCMIGFGSMKVAEGIVRFCPVMYMLGIDTLEKHFLEDEEELYECTCDGE